MTEDIDDVWNTLEPRLSFDEALDKSLAANKVARAIEYKQAEKKILKIKNEPAALLLKKEWARCHAEVQRIRKAHTRPIYKLIKQQPPGTRELTGIIIYFELHNDGQPYTYRDCVDRYKQYENSLNTEGSRSMVSIQEEVYQLPTKRCRNPENGFLNTGRKYDPLTSSMINTPMGIARTLTVCRPLLVLSECEFIYCVRQIQTLLAATRIEEESMSFKVRLINAIDKDYTARCMYSKAVTALKKNKQ